jgi:hypothetical protein
VNETGENPGGTGPPVGGLAAAVVVVVELLDVVDELVLVLVLVEDELADLAAGLAAPVVVLVALGLLAVVEVELFAAALPPQAASSNVPPTMATAENLFTNC